MSIYKYETFSQRKNGALIVESNPEVMRIAQASSVYIPPVFNAVKFENYDPWVFVEFSRPFLSGPPIC
jgi:hypothetical protein